MAANLASVLQAAVLLESLRARYPEQRIGQILCNAALYASNGRTHDPFHVSDDALIWGMERMLAEEMA